MIFSLLNTHVLLNDFRNQANIPLKEDMVNNLLTSQPPSSKSFPIILLCDVASI